MCYTSNNTITIQPDFGSAYFKHSLLIGNVNYEHTDTTWKSCDAVDVQCTCIGIGSKVMGYPTSQVFTYPHILRKCYEFISIGYIIRQDEYNGIVAGIRNVSRLLSI